MIELESEFHTVVFQARLQHPLGVCALEDIVYVADSYNHKIKVLRPRGKGFAAESLDLGGLNEPSGLCIRGSKLYIADTNNHQIKVLDLDTNEMSTVESMVHYSLTRAYCSM